MARNRVEVISSKGCTGLFAGASAARLSISSSQPADRMSQASITSSGPGAPGGSGRGPFTGLVICVTGLSKDARRQVKDATERLGGDYSPSLHPKCTHLIVQSCNGRKFEHASKHWLRNGLLVVSLGWLVDSVRRNVRLSESLYSVKNVGENTLPLMQLNRLAGYAGEQKSCFPAMLAEENRPDIWQSHAQFPTKESRMSTSPVLANDFIYIDSNVSSELRKKVIDAVVSAGAKVLGDWFVGCHASHVVCEGPYIQRYIGHTSNLVTPSWILKSIREKHKQRLVHLSTDIARQVAVILENAECTDERSKDEAPTNFREPLSNKNLEDTVEDRQKIADLAKMGVRSRRCRRMQSCQTPLHPITPNNLLDSICWSISEPPSSVRIYNDSCGPDSPEDASHPPASIFFNAGVDGRDPDVPSDNLCRPLKESEKADLIFKIHFLTILFPIDRFGELGPSSRTFFSDGGFTCIQVLDHVYNFYQEHMTSDEVALAIHTDSRHSDRLRSLYVSKESVDGGFVPFKRIDFLGSRRSFEMLKRVNGENNRNVYELVLRA